MAQAKFPAYDADGKEHLYTTALDARQACELAGYTLTRPGVESPQSAPARQDYENMNLDTLRKQCLVRQIPNYMRMNRDEWIEALKARDLDDAKRISGTPAPVATPTTHAPNTSPAPVVQGELETSKKPKNKPAA